MPHCAFEAYCFKFLITHLRNYRSRCLVVRLRKIRRVISLQALLADQRILPAAATHEGVRPVRMEMRVDLAVVAGDLTEIQQHAQEQYEAQAK